MKIAITGGTGFIGAPLVDRLLSSGHQILVLSRHPDSIGVRPNVRADFFDAQQAPKDRLLDGMDAVIHLAGESIAERWTAEHKDRILRSREKGTSAIARAAVQAQSVRVLVCGSAIGYYGPHASEELTEDSPPGNDFLATVCKVWEQAASPAREAGLRVVHLRTGIVLHPEGGALKKMLGPFKMGVGGRLGSGHQYMSWIHREDLLSLFVHATSKEALRGPLNGTAPNPVENQEFARVLGKVLHRPAVMPAPALALKLALGEMSSMVLTGQRVLPTAALASGFPFAFSELEPALQDLLGRRAESVPSGSVATGAARRH
jgi:uncharacterized protein (TIGR01777 family)